MTGNRVIDKSIKQVLLYLGIIGGLFLVLGLGILCAKISVLAIILYVIAVFIGVTFSVCYMDNKIDDELNQWDDSII